MRAEQEEKARREEGNTLNLKQRGEYQTAEGHFKRFRKKYKGHRNDKLWRKKAKLEMESCLFALTRLAAVYCTIIKPEFKPGLFIKKGGKSLLPDIKLKILLSEILPNSESEIFKKSIANANG